VAELGVLAATDGGVVVVSMAERLTAHTAACLSAVLDCGEILLPREGVFLRHGARVGIVALDEGMTEDEMLPHSLLDRLAFLIDLNGLSLRAGLVPAYTSEDILAARSLLPRVMIAEDILETLCATALALGVVSPRVSLLACRAARAAAALEGRIDVNEGDAVSAAELVLAPRTLIAPPLPQEQPQQQASEEQSPQQPPPAAQEPRPPSADVAQPRGGPDEPEKQAPAEPAEELASRVLAAAQASIPPGLLARIKADATSTRARPGGGGKSGLQQRAGTRGRPAGIRSGPPQGNARLNVIETLRAAAPWQRLRGRPAQGSSRVRVEAADFRVTRYKQRSATLTIFAVDASGSAALNRLAEAKGAVELLLADCYIRRDQVAVIAFRGRTAELLLPPTRSLVRAKRSLAALPGGGGTPLAAAIDASVALALQAQRRGETPTLVMLTDGRANVARSGAAGREAAHGDALRASKTVRLSGIKALFIDTSPRANALANELAAAMRARYVPLPFADSRALSDIVRAAAAVGT
jgi:magnesium chelatase subunit D